MAAKPTQQSIDAWWQWATAVLHGIGAPTTPTNYLTLWNWSLKESGGDPMNNGRIHNNPLNTTLGSPASGVTIPGATIGNSVGVMSYPDWQTGAAATAQTLNQGNFAPIKAALVQGLGTGSWNSSAIQNALKTWGSGTNWLHNFTPPPKPSQDFQNANSGIGSNTYTSSGSNPVQDALNAALGPVGDAITKSTNTFVQKASYVALMALGGFIMLSGFGLLAFLALKTPAGKAVTAAAEATPQGRAAGATVGAARAASASKSTPTPEQKPSPSNGATAPAPATALKRKPLSPQAQASLAAARAGRGSKLSPEVKAELREREG